MRVGAQCLLRSGPYVFPGAFDSPVRGWHQDRKREEGSEEMMGGGEGNGNRESKIKVWGRGEHLIIPCGSLIREL